MYWYKQVICRWWCCVILACGVQWSGRGEWWRRWSLTVEEVWQRVWEWLLPEAICQEKTGVLGPSSTLQQLTVPAGVGLCFIQWILSYPNPIGQMPQTVCSDKWKVQISAIQSNTTLYKYTCMCSYCTYIYFCSNSAIFKQRKHACDWKCTDCIYCVCALVR